MKRKTLFWIFFIMFVNLGTYMAKQFYLFIIAIFPPITGFNVLAILLYVLIAFPASAYFAEKVSYYSLDLGLDQRKPFVIFVTIVIIVPASLFTISKINEYKVKGLDHVIRYDVQDVHSIILNEGIEDGEWKTKDETFMDKLNTFLGQYKVKKINEQEWDEKEIIGNGFTLSVYTEKGFQGALVASIYQNGLLFYNDGSYYEVINGPVDIEWIEKQKVKYE